MLNNHRIVITPGEPSGIGPDLIIMLAQKAWPVELVVCTDPFLLTQRAIKLNLPIKLHSYQKKQSPRPHPAGEISVLSIKSFYHVEPGKLNSANSSHVIETLSRACDGCLDKEFAALLTGPVHKGIINDSGFPFVGHTEFFAERSGCSNVVMMLVTQSLRIALATTHIPLSEVPKKITHRLLHKVITILMRGLYKQFRIKNPRVYICSLNPHAGEGGYIGREEIEIIIPSLNLLRSEGYDLVGPLPSDTIFQKKYLEQADAILALYHDQGLPILKSQGFGKAVNITLGLPFIRTSVDHGTAIELSGTGLAKVSSMKMALHLTMRMIDAVNE